MHLRNSALTYGKLTLNRSINHSYINIQARLILHLTYLKIDFFKTRIYIFKYGIFLRMKKLLQHRGTKSQNSEAVISSSFHSRLKHVFNFW